MNNLSAALRDAAGDDDVRFDHHDVRARAVRRRRRNRAIAFAAVLLTVGATVGLTTGDGDQNVDSVRPASEITREELVGDLWIPMTYSELGEPPDESYLRFTSDGTFGGVDGCVPLLGEWHLDGEQLHVDDLRGWPGECEPLAGGIHELLRGAPELRRVEGSARGIELRSGDRSVRFERFDRLGEAPTTENVVGTWSLGGEIVLRSDGTAAIRIAGCGEQAQWSLEDDRLAFDGIDASGIPCGEEGVVGGGLLLFATEEPRVRVTPTALWWSADLGVLRLERASTADSPDLVDRLLTDAAIDELLPELTPTETTAGLDHVLIGAAELVGPTEEASGGVARQWSQPHFWSAGDAVPNEVINVSSTALTFPSPRSAMQAAAEVIAAAHAEYGDRAETIPGSHPFQAVCSVGSSGPDIRSCLAVAAVDTTLVGVQLDYVGDVDAPTMFAALLAAARERVR